MDKKKYFSDLLYLSESFSLEEKKQIYKIYTKNPEKLENGIAIFEEELRDLIRIYIDYEEKKMALSAEFLQNLSHPGKNADAARILKIQQMLEKNKATELSENEHAEDILNNL